jgi:alpha-tubulin suppressor-like RCC1 family protein
VTDPDGDTVSLSYAWKVNGLSIAAATGPSLAPTYFRKGDSVQVAVTPNDGEVSGLSVASPVVLPANTPPSISSVSVSPSTGDRGTTFVCTPSGWTDADGDSPAYGYEWKVGSQVVGTAASLSGALLSRGQGLTCVVTPTDGETPGAAVSSLPITIANSIPTLASVGLSPASPTKRDTLSATVSGFTDLDGDAAGYRYTWLRDGVAIPNQSGASLPASEFARGQVISVEVRPWDGLEQGAAVRSASVTVLNSAPTVASVSVAPAGGGTATRGKSLVATVTGAEDPDGDAITLTYAWSPGFTQTGSVLPGTAFSRGDTVSVTVTPSDGLAPGGSVSSSAVTIQNAPPSCSVSLTPSTPGSGDSLLCAPDNCTDADDDLMTYSFQWTRNGVAYSFQNFSWSGSSIPSSATEPSDTFRCTLIARDQCGKDENPCSLSSTTLGATSTPVQAEVTVRPPWTKVVAGRYQGFGIGSDGALWQWGLGQNNTADATHFSTPTKLGTGYATVAAAWDHVLALKTDGTLWAWGSNGSGQLGVGDNSNRTGPTYVGSGFTAVSTGQYFSMALKSDGTLWTWGLSTVLGGRTGTQQAPGALALQGCTSFAAGREHALAVCSNGTLYAWGPNASGQLGLGDTTYRSSPTVVGTGYQSVSAGVDSSFAIATDGTTYAWGKNSDGTLGLGDTQDRNLPTPLTMAFVAVFPAERHVLGLKSDGTLWSWGANIMALGRSTSPYGSPGLVGSSYQSASAGNQYSSFGIALDGTIRSWGDNSNQQLGRTGGSATPTEGP